MFWTNRLVLTSPVSTSFICSCPGKSPCFLALSAFFRSLPGFGLPDLQSGNLPNLRIITFWIILFLDYHPTEFLFSGFIARIIVNGNCLLSVVQLLHASYELVPNSIKLHFISNSVRVCCFWVQFQTHVKESSSVRTQYNTINQSTNQLPWPSA